MKSGDTGRPIPWVRASPALFSFFTFFVLVVPFVKSLFIAFNPNVVFWMGIAPKVAVLFVPALVLLGFVIHSCLNRPSKIVVIVSLVVPCVILLVMGDTVLMNAMNEGNRLSSADCYIWSKKAEMEQSWQSAADFYTACGHDANLTRRGTYRIQECPGYAGQLKDHPDWSYLATLEKMYDCGGWCEPHRPLWQYGAHPVDACSHAAGTVFTVKVRHVALQIVIYSIIIVGVTAALLILWGGSGGDGSYFGW